MASSSVVRDMGETLASVLQAALTGMVASANVRIATPDIFHELKPTPQPTCTIFLYRVAVNPAARSEPGAPPEGVSRPTAAARRSLVFDNALGQRPAR